MLTYHHLLLYQSRVIEGSIHKVLVKYCACPHVENGIVPVSLTGTTGSLQRVASKDLALNMTLINDIADRQTLSYSGNQSQKLWKKLEKIVEIRNK